MKKWGSGLIGALLFFFCGCNSLDFDFFKDKPKEEEPRRSPYSILTEPGKGGRIIDSGSGGNDIVALPELPGDPLQGVPDIPEDDSAGKKGSKAPEKDVDALFKKLFPHQKEGGSETIKVAINYDAANLADVIPSFAAPLKLNYILDPGVSGTVTMSLKADMTPREVWTLFEQILQMTGAYCEMEDQVVHIRPLAKIPQEKKMLRLDSNIDVRLVPLRYVPAKEIVSQLKSFLSDAATAVALDKQNAVLLVENVANMGRLLGLVELLDQRTRAGWQRAVFVCRNVPAAQIQKELSELLPVLGFPVSDDKHNGENGEISIACLDRIQAIVVSAVSEEPLREIRKWVSRLDKSDVGEQERVFLYDVINAKADELVNALSVIFPVESSIMSINGTGQASASSSTGVKVGSGTSGAASSSSKGTKSATVTAAATGAKNADKTSNSIYDTPVKIFADAVHNRLLVRTTPRTYAMVRAILNRLDTIPAQILMQVLVVEIELSDSNEFGMEFSMSGGSGNQQSIFGTNFEALSPNTSGTNPQSGGSYTIFNPNNPEEKFGYIRALASKNKLRVLSSPQIIAKSNSTAKISVGKRVPIVTSEISDTQSTTTSDTSLLRSYQYEDTGIILTITPQVTKGGMISMALEQVISDAMENTMKGIDSPIIKEDVLETELSIRDGRTLIMGGLIKEKQNEIISSLPWVIDIPFLRTFFSNTTKTAERTEILMLITATIIREDSELEDMIRRYNEAIREIDKFESRQYRSAIEREKEKKPTQASASAKREE